MSITKVINIEVRDGDVKALQKDLQSVERQFDRVDGEAKKASTSIKDVGENGGAISTLDSVTGGLATRIRDAAEASKLFNISLKGTRTALIATGIGAFVVALGAVVAYWDDIVGFITGANKELERQEQIQSRVTDEVERELELLDKQDNILKLQGKSQEEINKLKKDALQLVIREQEESLILAQQRLKELQEIQKGGGSALEAFFKTGFNLLEAFGALVDNTLGKLGLDTGFQNFVAEKGASVLETVFGTQEDIDEAKSRVEELENSILDARNRLAGIELSESETGGRNRVSGLDGILSAEEQQKENERLSKIFEERLNLEQIQQDALLEIQRKGLNEIENSELLALNRRNRARLDFFEFQKQQELAELQFQREVNSEKANVAIQLGQLLQNLAGENKELAIAGIIIEKVASISQIISQTAIANAKSVAASPLTAGQPWVGINTVSAGLSIAGTIAAAAKAISQIGGGSAGGGLGGSSLPNAQQTAPSFNLVGTSGTNQLAQSLSQGQEPIQTYVVAGQVTTQQELDNNIVDTASIG